MTRQLTMSPPKALRHGLTLMALLALFLAACSQPAGQGGPSSSAGPSSGSGKNPACGLITLEIAAKAVPGIMFASQDSPGLPPRSKAYSCVYVSKSGTGMTGLSVALTTPASPGDISKARSTSDCSPVAGIGDFACLQWTGYFRGEAGGASANVVLTAVRGNEVLEMPYVTGPPMAGGGIPDGNAMGRALSQAAVDAGWGNGTALDVPAAPAAGPPATTNNAVCALVSPQKVQQAFGAKAPPQILPNEVSCRYTFGELGTPGPDSMVFSMEVLQDAAPAMGGPGPRGEPLEGIGDRAWFFMTTEPAGPKSLRPAGDVPITILAISAVRGQNLATFTAQVLVSPTGPTAEQTRDQLISLVRGIEF